MKATFDFEKKTIKFEGQYKIADVHIIQDLLGADWQEWTVVQDERDSSQRVFRVPVSEVPGWRETTSAIYPPSAPAITVANTPLPADKYKAT